MKGDATITLTSAVPLPGPAIYQYQSQGTVSANFRVQRNF
jgi:hypothetical protein